MNEHNPDHAGMAANPNKPCKSSGALDGNSGDVYLLRGVDACRLCGAPVGAFIGIDERYCNECRALDSGQIR